MQIRDQAATAVAGAPVRLGILHQTVASGERRDYREAVTGADGSVDFTGLEGGSAFSYRVTVTTGPATYASEPMNLMAAVGHRVLLHVFPVTRDVKSALVGTRGSVSIVPREDVFHFDVAFRLFNVGAVTWVPENVKLALPSGWKGFNAEEGMSDVRVVADGDHGARLEGTISPGQHDVAFRFQVPSSHEAAMRFAMELPPHLMQMTVAAAAPPGAELTVEGFPAASKDESNRRVLRTDRVLRPGEPEMKRLVMALTGMPTPSTGRWWALGVAACVGALGLVLGARGEPSKEASSDDARAARDRILDELVALERARSTGAVGPRTYQETRRLLFQALARIVALSPPAPEARAKRRARAARPSDHPKTR